MKVFNTLSRTMEEIIPLDGRTVRMYTCGPTVYNYAHIGNFRAYIFEDLLRRYLKWSGMDVVQVMNLTDVDDKTIRGALEKSVSLVEYTKTYVDAFFADLSVLNIEPAEHYPAATAHIKEMQDIIATLLSSGYAYQSDDGSIYFDVARYADYGKLAHIDKSGMKAGARVDLDEYEKHNVADFALWKAWSESDGNIAWDSPWGRGRPGWHIECSAMGMKYLGESFDIHTGGVDNMFPHHENEIAQSEAATGKTFVRYWMHCAHLQVDGQKMSKSLGNFFTLRDILSRGYTGREIRYVLLSAHYRQTLNFTFDALDAARASLSRLDDFISRLESVAGQSSELSDNPEWAEKAVSQFKAALDDDLNMPEAMAALFRLVHDGNKIMDSESLSPGEASAVISILCSLDKVLGYLKKPAEEAPDEEVLALLVSRSEARKNRNWAESDLIRDKLAVMGWEVKDTSDGQKVKKR